MKHSICPVTLAFVAFTSLNAATPISFTGTDYTQNFDTLPLSGTNPLVTNQGRGPLDVPTSATGVSLEGWSFSNPTGSGTNAIFRYDNGSSNSGAVFSYGTTAATDRALGALASGTTISNFGAVFVNDTASTLTSFTLTYTGEQWRIGDAAVPNTLSFAYALGATDLNSGTFLAVANLNFTSPINTGPAGGAALDGNLPANQTAITYTVSSLLWNPGATLTLRWTDVNDGGSDDGLAVDNLTLSAIATTVNTVVWNAPGGTWDTTTANWTGSATVFQNGDIAQFTDAGLGVVNIDAGGVAPALVEVKNTTGTYTFQGGPLTGGGSLTKTGAGTLVLGAESQLSGGVDIEGGILRTSASDRLSDTSTVTVGTGALLDLQGNSDTIGALLLNGGSVDSGAGVLTLGGNVTIQQNAQTASIKGFLNTGSPSHTMLVADGASAVDLQIDAELTGGARIVFNGAGTTALNGNNSGFSGGISLNAGVLAINSGNSLGAGSFFFNGGTLASTTAVTLASAVSVGGNVTIDATLGDIEFQSLSSSFGSATKVMSVLGNATISGAVTGTSVINKGGAGTLTLTADNIYTTATTVQAGSLVISPSGAISASPSLSISSGATLQIQNPISLSDTIQLILVSGATFKLDFAGTETIGSLAIGGTYVDIGLYSLAQLQALPGGVNFVGDSSALLNVTAAAVPEPGVVSLMIIGLGGLLFVCRRRVGA